MTPCMPGDRVEACATGTMDVWQSATVVATLYVNQREKPYYLLRVDEDGLGSVSHLPGLPDNVRLYVPPKMQFSYHDWVKPMSLLERLAEET